MEGGALGKEEEGRSIEVRKGGEWREDEEEGGRTGDRKQQGRLEGQERRKRNRWEEG